MVLLEPLMAYYKEKLKSDGEKRLFISGYSERKFVRQISAYVDSIVAFIRTYFN
jgi:hypothetical protein